MSILNVTPDSFSDGGLYLDTARAVEHGRQMVADGADLIDIGGESTRPGSHAVSDDMQIARVVPVIQGLREAGISVPISIDTQSSVVAAAALLAGADIVNDISGIRHDPRMPELLCESGVPFVVMHMQGTPVTMQANPHYNDVAGEVAAFFEERATVLAAAGVDCNRMIIDPGIGFGKKLEHNLTLLRSLDRFASRFPLLVGPSRKRFIRELLRIPSESNIPLPQTELRNPNSTIDNSLLAGTFVAALHCALSGANILRVHDVGPIRRVLESVATA